MNEMEKKNKENCEVLIQDVSLKEFTLKDFDDHFGGGSKIIFS